MDNQITLGSALATFWSFFVCTPAEKKSAIVTAISLVTVSAHELEIPWMALSAESCVRTAFVAPYGGLTVSHRWGTPRARSSSIALGTMRSSYL